MPRGIKYTSEQREELRKKAVDMRKQGKPMTEIARSLNIAMGTLNRLVGKAGGRRGRKRAVAEPRQQADIRLSASNPMAQLAVAHERLMALNGQIEKLTSERDKVLEKMDGLMKKASEVCPGLKKK
jgi:orotate phosphoribosyltransferase-like protein